MRLGRLAAASGFSAGELVGSHCDTLFCADFAKGRNLTVVPMSMDLMSFSRELLVSHKVFKQWLWQLRGVPAA